MIDIMIFITTKMMRLLPCLLVQIEATYININYIICHLFDQNIHKMNHTKSVLQMLRMREMFCKKGYTGRSQMG